MFLNPVQPVPSGSI